MKVHLKLFALYRERAGLEETTVDVPAGTDVAGLVEQLRREFPGLQGLPQRVLAAVNMEYVPLDHRLDEGDEVALIPPVAGGAPETQVDRVCIVERPIEPAALLAEVATTAAGAQVLFLGTVRDVAEGREVVSLHYEAYPAMAEKTLAGIVADARSRWPLCRIAVEHRIGPLELGDVAVAVAVSAPHRAEAFEAGRFLIDTLKQLAPIWKKERYRDGEQWIDPSAPTAGA